MTKWAAVNLLLVAFLGGVVLAGMTGQQASAVLVVQVVDASTGQAVVGATVTAAPVARHRTSPRSYRTATTDPRGSAQFDRLASGEYSLQATHQEYLPGSAGNVGPIHVLRPVTVFDGQRIEAAIRLWRAARLRGAARLPEKSGPATATLLRLVEVCGTSELRRIQSTAVTGGHAFAFSGVAPGRYAVAVSGPAIPAAFHPADPFAQSWSLLDVEPGADLSGLEIRSPEGERVAISGRLSSELARRDRWPKFLELSPESASGVPSNLPTSRVAVADDSFTFPPVVPGRYRLRGVEFPPVDSRSMATQSGSTWSFPQRPPAVLKEVSDEDTWWVDAEIDARDSPLRLALELRPGHRISGRIDTSLVADRTATAGLRSVPIFATPVDGEVRGSHQAAAIDDNLRFRTVGLFPGKYVLAPALVPLKSTLRLVRIVSRGVDVTGGGVDLTHGDESDVVIYLTDRAPSVSGIVSAGDDSIARLGAQAFVFPADPARWTGCGLSGMEMFETPIGPDGGYRLDGLLPGEYLVAAAVNPRLDWFRPDYLQRLASFAQRIRLEVGQAVTVHLRAQSIR